MWLVPRTEHLGRSIWDKAHRIVIDKLLENADIFCIQETLLAKKDLDQLNSLNLNNFP